MLPPALVDLLHLPPEASSAAPDIDALHAVVIGVSVVGAVGVSLIALRSVLRHRTTPEATTTTPHVEAKRVHELGIAGAMLVLFVAFWVVGYRQYVELRTPPADALLVYVTGKQWMWKFGYLGG